MKNTAEFLSNTQRMRQIALHLGHSGRVHLWRSRVSLPTRTLQPSTTAQPTASCETEKLHNAHDRSLLEYIAQGSEAALIQFYRAFESRVFAYINIRLHDKDETADVLNDVMWEVWRGAKTFQGRSSVSTWVFGIAHHKVIDRLRRSGKHPTEQFEEALFEPSTLNLDEILLKKQLGLHVQHCMDKLSTDHRQTVHLAFFEDLSYREIAEITGSPEGTIKARMFHAKQALKRCLQRRLQQNNTRNP